MFTRSYSPWIPSSSSTSHSLFSSNEWEFVRIVDDVNVLTECMRIKEQLDLCSTQRRVILIIGIGGSSAGTLAILQAYYGLKQPDHIRWYCADTFHEELTQQLLDTLQEHIGAGDQIVVCIISKSGTTTETLVNASLFVQLLQKNVINYSLIVISNNNSPLHKLAHEKRYHFISIPAQLGGRFSVFSAVGIMPLLLCDVPVEELLAGARTMQIMCKQLDEHSPAIRSAHYLVHQYRQGKTVLDIFITQPRLWSLALWYRQLIGESLGKDQTIGFVPTITHATTDLHSVTQKILGGPNDTVTNFIFSNAQSAHSLMLAKDHFTQIADLPDQLSLSALHDAIMQGVKRAYEKKDRAYIEYNLDGSLFELGSFLQYKMCEVAYTATLLQINPFDQPEVELYKQETRALLHKTE